MAGWRAPMTGRDLGLPLTRHFLDRQQGTIEIDNVPNIGTRIIARLPASRTLAHIAPAAD
jgi:signal transduction histidine kinase